MRSDIFLDTYTRPRPNIRVTRGHLSPNHLVWLGFQRHQIQRACEADQTLCFRPCDKGR